MGCFSTNEKSLIVTTINPILCSRPVHPGTKNVQFVALKAGKTSSLHTIFYFKNHKQTKQLVVLISNRAYFLIFNPIGINTHIDLSKQ